MRSSAPGGTRHDANHAPVFKADRRSSTRSRHPRRDDDLPLLGVAEKLVEGEILYREGKKDAGIDAIHEAVAREDALRGGLEGCGHPAEVVVFLPARGLVSRGCGSKPTSVSH